MGRLDLVNDWIIRKNFDVEDADEVCHLKKNPILSFDENKHVSSSADDHQHP